MKIYNTMTRQKEEFVPITPGKVNIYACGPTVYNYIHIGNARPICLFDVLRRFMEYQGYEVIFIQNFTDIDDKLIRKSEEEGITVAQIADRYIEEYWTDVNGLGVRKATIHPKATESIDKIIEVISDLEAKGFAYANQGSVYFRTRKFPEYGKLSGQSLEDLESGARIDVSEEKEDPLDFVLWKAAKPGEPHWSSPWGEGRPGWHIECTAMIESNFGPTIDIHCGGQDLVFPHHENEIAQGECFTGTTYVNYWMHNAFINVDNKKMSKSEGNFFTVRDVAERFGYEPIKFFMLSAHYRSPLSYSFDVLEQSRAALDRLYGCRDNIDFAIKTAPETGSGDAALAESVELYKKKFEEAMLDDMNTADALAALFEMVKSINTVLSESPSKAAAANAAKVFDTITDVLGILYNRKDQNLDADIEALIEKRQQARKDKDFKLADQIRDELKEKGITLEDTPQGVKWKRGE